MSNKLILIVVILLVLIGGTYLINQSNTIDTNKKGDLVSSIPKTKAVIYKSPTCGCCVGYASDMRRKGYDVEVIKTDDMDTIKAKYNIPSNMESCHTTIIGDYFVEGHTPFDVVEKLLSEKPDIDGIALPNMPSGSPGMPGIKKGLFKIYQLTDGESSLYMEI